jgi:hypothetical protein
MRILLPVRVPQQLLQQERVLANPLHRLDQKRSKLVLRVIEIGELCQRAILTLLDREFVCVRKVCAKGLVDFKAFFHACKQRTEFLFFVGEGDEDFDADEEAALEFDELGEVGEEEVDGVAVQQILCL